MKLPQNYLLFFKKKHKLEKSQIYSLLALLNDKQQKKYSDVADANLLLLFWEIYRQGFKKGYSIYTR